MQNGIRPWLSPLGEIAIDVFEFSLQGFVATGEVGNQSRGEAIVASFVCQAKARPDIVCRQKAFRQHGHELPQDSGGSCPVNQ